MLLNVRRQNESRHRTEEPRSDLERADALPRCRSAGLLPPGGRPGERPRGRVASPPPGALAALCKKAEALTTGPVLHGRDGGRDGGWPNCMEAR